MGHDVYVNMLWKKLRITLYASYMYFYFIYVFYFNIYKYHCTYVYVYLLVNILLYLRKLGACFKTSEEPAK